MLLLILSHITKTFIFFAVILQVSAATFRALSSIPTFWHPGKTQLHATGPQHFTKRWKATLPSANVRASGSCASSGLQTGASRPPLRWARCSQHGPIPGCLPPNGHQARATRLLLWLWWGLSHFLEMFLGVHNLAGLHESWNGFCVFARACDF